MEKKQKSGNKTTRIESESNDSIENEKLENEGNKNEGNKNEGNKNEIKGEIKMEEKEKNDKMNFGQEYGSSITESLTTRQYLSDSAWILDNFNPVERTLKFREDMPDDESRKLIDGFVKADMPTFLDHSRKVAENCLDVGLEISDIAKTLSKKRRESIEKY